MSNCYITNVWQIVIYFYYYRHQSNYGSKPLFRNCALAIFSGFTEVEIWILQAPKVDYYLIMLVLCNFYPALTILFIFSLNCNFVCCCCYQCFVQFGIAFSCRSERWKTSIQDMGGGTSIIRYLIQLLIHSLMFLVELCWNLAVVSNLSFMKKSTYMTEYMYYLFTFSYLFPLVFYRQLYTFALSIWLMSLLCFYYILNRMKHDVWKLFGL